MLLLWVHINTLTMEVLTDLQELLRHELKDLYSAETQLIKALPLMEEAATHPALKKAFKDHLSVTRKQRDRLAKVQKILNEEDVIKENKGFFAKLFQSDEGDEHCKAMEGLVKEAKSLISKEMEDEVMDAALIAAAQKVEHYEISSYGTAVAFATQIGLKKAADLLKETLEEERDADATLTELAMNKINKAADPSGMNQAINYAKTAQANRSAKEATKAPSASMKKSAPKKAAPKKTAAKKSSSKNKKTRR